MDLKAVVFDYGGVLCFYPPENEVTELAALCGLGRDSFLELYWGLRIPYDRGDFDGPSYWRELGLRAGKSYSDSEVAEFIARDVHFWSHLDPLMLDWVARLRAAGLRIGLLSNMPAELGAWVRSLDDFTALFDHMTFSFAVRAVKPDAAIYLDAVRGLGVAPGEALFLDDKAPNVAGAEAAGLRGALFLSRETFAAELPELAPALHHLVPLGATPVIRK